MMTTVAIIGAGPLGRWLAKRAAEVGHRVLLEDVMPTNLAHAREEIRQQFSAEALPEIEFVSTIEDAVRTADLVVDCVPDELESKLEILWLLDRMAPPHTIFVTPTKRLSIADLANTIYRPAQMVGVSTNAVELKSEESSSLTCIVTAKTSEQTKDAVKAFWATLGFAMSFEVDPTVLT